jgi:hypothetical protein
VVSNALTELEAKKNNNNNRGIAEAKTRGEAHIPFTTMLVSYVTSYNKQARSVCTPRKGSSKTKRIKREWKSTVSCPCRGEAHDILPMRGMAMVTAAKASNTSLKGKQF